MGGTENAEYETDRFGGISPEKHGDGLIRLALDILARKAVPPAVFTGHEVITPNNVDHPYPNDSLLAMPAV